MFLPCHIVMFFFSFDSTTNRFLPHRLDIVQKLLLQTSHTKVGKLYLSRWRIGLIPYRYFAIQQSAHTRDCRYVVGRQDSPGIYLNNPLFSLCQNSTTLTVWLYEKKCEVNSWLRNVNRSGDAVHYRFLPLSIYLYTKIPSLHHIGIQCTFTLVYISWIVSNHLSKNPHEH